MQLHIRTGQDIWLGEVPNLVLPRNQSYTTQSKLSIVGDIRTLKLLSSIKYYSFKDKGIKKEVMLYI